MEKVLFALPVPTLTSTSVFVVDAGNGSAKSIGKIVDAVRIVSSDTRKQEIVLGRTNKSVFTATSNKSAATPLKIKPEDYGISTLKNVEISSSGVDDVDSNKPTPADTEPSAAAGMGISIYDNANTLVGLDTGEFVTVPKESQTILYFTVNYAATKNAVTIGYDNVEIDFNLTYG